MDDSKTVGASLLAKAVSQSKLDCLTQRHREQAHSLYVALTSVDSDLSSLVRTYEDVFLGETDHS